MSTLTLLADALAIKGLTLDHARNLDKLNRKQVDHVRWAYEYAKTYAKEHSLHATHTRYAGWRAKGQICPRSDFTLRPGEDLDDRELDVIFASALNTRKMTLADAAAPRTNHDPVREIILWAILYTIGHMRRREHARELRANPMTHDEFARELACM